MRFSVSILIAVLIAAVLAAQAPPAPQQPTFRTGVNFVRVDVYPTAQGGRPVADLTKDDFEILEDGVPQAVNTFEHIVVRPREITSERVEPRNAAEANRQAADARNRVFVLFLDTYHVTDETSMHSGQVRIPGSMTTRRPVQRKPLGPGRIDRALMNFVDRVVGPNDLFAAITPEMDISELTFTRRPENVDDLVKTIWGRRFSWDDLDPEEERWAMCYSPDSVCNCWPGILQQMVLRRREGLTLEALGRLVDRLGELREERKAILLVSEGWALYRPDLQLARPLAWVEDPPKCSCPVVVPGGKGIYVGTDGKPRAGTDERTFMYVDHQQCDAARATLAHVDDEQPYRALLDRANRTNTSFYPIDPRGLAVFDTPIDYTDLPNTPPRLAATPGGLFQEVDNLRNRLETLRNLASATDGRMTETNDIAGGLKKIADDLSDYYLLGYYSTNAKADGTFRKIAVRVKRPGVSVRARRGYLAASEKEAAALRAASVPVDPDVATRAAALGALDAIRAGRPLRLAAGVAWQAATGGEARKPIVWVAGELDIAAARELEWSAGAQASIALTTATGQSAATAQATASPAARSFVLYLPQQLSPGSYLVTARLQGKAGGGADASEQVRIAVPSTASALEAPLVFRRGPYTGPGFQPTADLRFRKAERIRLDVPVADGGTAITARVLDRKGTALPIPVTIGQREEGSVRFATAEVTLAPLALGDYLIEVAARIGDKQEKMVTAVRIVP